MNSVERVSSLYPTNLIRQMLTEAIFLSRSLENNKGRIYTGVYEKWTVLIRPDGARGSRDEDNRVNLTRSKVRSPRHTVEATPPGGLRTLMIILNVILV